MLSKSSILFESFWKICYLRGSVNHLIHAPVGTVATTQGCCAELHFPFICKTSFFIAVKCCL